MSKPARKPFAHRQKILSLKDAVATAKRLRKSGKKLVTTNGCFDLLHVGHVRSLAFARAQGDVLFVGINSDASVRANKGPERPVIPARERAEMLAALSFVDYVFIFNSKTPISWLLEVKPHAHVKSSDYTMEQVIEREVVERGSGRIVLAPHTGKHSTTKLIQKIRNTKGS